MFEVALRRNSPITVLVFRRIVVTHIWESCIPKATKGLHHSPRYTCLGNSIYTDTLEEVLYIHMCIIPKMRIQILVKLRMWSGWEVFWGRSECHFQAVLANLVGSKLVWEQAWEQACLGAVWEQACLGANLFGRRISANQSAR